MRRTIPLVLATLVVFSLQAQTIYTYAGQGAWTDVANWSPSYPGTNLNAADEAIIAPGSKVTIANINTYGKLTNKGSVVINGFYYNYGTIKNDSLFTNTGNTYNYGLLQNDSIFTSSSFFENHKTILNNRSFYSNSFFENSGSLTNNGYMKFTSYFSGRNISHEGNNVVFSGCFLSAGSTSTPVIGRYLFNNDFNFCSYCTITHDMGGPSNADTLVVMGNASIDKAALNLTLRNNYDPAIGTTFTVLSAKSITGQFYLVTQPYNLSTDKAFEVIYSSTKIEVKVVEKTITGISADESSATKVTIFPNPASDNIAVTGLTQESAASVYNMLGHKVTSATIDPIKNQIPLNNLPKGTYVLRVNNQAIPFMKF